MDNFGEHWDRYSSRHLGEWHGRSLALLPSATPLLSRQYVLNTLEVSRSKTNSTTVHQKISIHLQPGNNEQLTNSATATIRYNLSTFHVFPDSTYSCDHSLPELPLLLPDDLSPQSAIQFALPLSATERVRCFLLYDSERTLSCILLLEEVRSSLFETRQPLALTSLIGRWQGQAETYRHEEPQPLGFGKSAMPSKPRPKYSKEDLPEPLKHPSSTVDGLFKTKTTVDFGWDPASSTVRRSTILHDMQDQELLQMVSHGLLQDSGLFDSAVFGQGTPSQTIMLILSNACFVIAPIRRVKGVSVIAEVGCLVTPQFRRRIMRIYGKNVVSSETLASESLL